MNRLPVIIALPALAAALSIFAPTACSSTDDGGTITCGAGTTLVDGICVPASEDTTDTFGGGGEAGGFDGFGGGKEETTEGADVADGQGGDDSEGDGDGGGSDTTADTGGGGCQDGERVCQNNKVYLICNQGQWQPQPCPGDLMCVEGFCTDVVECDPGTVDGCIDSSFQKVCDDTGVGFVPKKCPEGQWCYQGNCGAQLCGQNETKCLSPSVVGKCNDDFTSYEPYLDCGPTAVCVGDKCLSGCDALIKYNKSYIGCEYWTVDLDQYDDPFGTEKNADYAIVIGNPGLQTVNLQFVLADGSAVNIPDPTVAPGSSKAFVMPTLNVDGTGISQKSVRVLSDFPVVAYQFNPLYGGGGGIFTGIASNDASLLLPIHAIGKEYWISTWPTAQLIDIGGLGIQPQHGYLTVVAVDPGETQVFVKTTAFSKAGPGVNAMKPGDLQEFTLNRFDVLNIEADKGGLTFNLKEVDLTGTHVYANKNIVVFAGHEQAVISDDNDRTCCAEHLEEQLWPVSAWRNEFVCVKTSPRGTSDIEPDLWRVLASKDGTQITTSPPIPGLNGKTLNRGEWVEAFTAQSFVLTGTGPLQVMQYTTARDRTEQFTGDPSMMLTVPPQQYRDSYNILTPDGYSKDFVTIIRPVGLPVMLDGNQISEALFTPLGGSQWEYGYVPMQAGPHVLGAAEPFGVISYGWSNAVSYGLPAGLNLIGN